MDVSVQYQASAALVTGKCPWYRLCMSHRGHRPSTKNMGKSNARFFLLRVQPSLICYPVRNPLAIPTWLSQIQTSNLVLQHLASYLDRLPVILNKESRVFPLCL